MANITVFYSWQSDASDKTGRNLIRDALEEAVSRLAADATLELRPEIDQDTAGVPGSPNIVLEILRKIDACGVFVADTTLTYERRSVDGRRSPNPNVLLELGYALKRLGWERVLQVINTAQGQPDELPFDLRGHRAVTYNAPDGSRPSDALPGLTSDLEDHLRLILSRAGLPGDLLTPVKLEIGYRDRNITSDRHEYRLTVTAENTGDEIISDWAVEIRLPREVLEPRQSYSIVEPSSSRKEAVMRWTEQEHSGPIYPGDVKEVVGLDYFMDDELYSRRSELFRKDVRVGFFIGGKRIASESKALRDLQDF